jgi:hypothetical protein
MNPLDGNPLLLAAAKASVGPQLLPDLVEHVQDHLGPRLEAYRREYERALRTDDYEVFFVEAGHWDDLGEEFDLEPRERDAVKRAHEEQLLHAGGEMDRRGEFDTALELREVVVVGVE